ncbi:MAG: DUF354 domain-containing protein [Ignavibacteriales bacterium]|nr:DUF354 domain-containing protein [Ignavibacteriales bacterium]
MKKICFHLAHPAHYHLFKNIIKALQVDNNVLITYNDKDVLKYLLENDREYNFKFVKIDSLRKSNSILSLSSEFVQKEFGLYKVLKKERPDLIVGTSIIIAHIGKLLGIKSIIVNEDDFDVVYNSVRIGYPFANNILSPACCRTLHFESKSITYSGYHELAYLTPEFFQPNLNNIIELTSNNVSKYFIIRFSALAAHHDVGKSGISSEIAEKIISLLSQYGRVYISSEKDLPKRFAKYRISIDPLKIHDALNFSFLYIGDSQTMAAEAAVLGVPSIRFNDFVGKLSYLEELEHKYGLTYGIKTSEPEKLFQKIDELLSMPNLKEEWQKRRMKMLADKIDVTAFMVWFIENYPESVKVMKENPEYQERFK